MEGGLSQIALYDEGVVELERWLDEQEQNLNEQSEPQGTLPEKKAQLERAKVGNHVHKILHLSTQNQDLNQEQQLGHVFIASSSYYPVLLTCYLLLNRPYR